MKCPLTDVVCTVSHHHPLRTIPDSPRGPETKPRKFKTVHKQSTLWLMVQTDAVLTLKEP